MDSLLKERKAAFARSRESEQKESRPMTFGKVVGAVIVGNIVFGLIVAAVYELLKLIP